MRHTGNRRAAAVAVQAEHVGVEVLCRLEKVGVVVDAYTGVMDLENLHRHGPSPPVFCGSIGDYAGGGSIVPLGSAAQWS